MITVLLFLILEMATDEILDLDAISPPSPTPNQPQNSNCLVGRLLVDKSINHFALLDVMRKAWKPKKGMDAREWSRNLFLFRFQEPAEMKWVLRNQPWHFDGHIFLIRPLEEMEQPSKVQILGAQIWIRIYDAPVRCMNNSTAKLLGQKIGKLITIDPALDPFGKYIRVKVELNVTKPLKSGIKVKLGGQELWLPLKYEGLPTYCYKCGLMGHTFKYCEENSNEEDLDPLDLPFGPNIKASPLKKTRLPSAKLEILPSSLKKLQTPRHKSLFQTKDGENQEDTPLTCPPPHHSPTKETELITPPCLTTETPHTPLPITYTPTPNKTQENMDLDTTPPLTAPITTHTELPLPITPPHTSPQPELENPNRKSTKKLWKKWARAKRDQTEAASEEESRKRDFTQIQLLNEPEEIETKRLKFMSIEFDDESAAEVTEELPRRHQ